MPRKISILVTLLLMPILLIGFTPMAFDLSMRVLHQNSNSSNFYDLVGLGTLYFLVIFSPWLGILTYAITNTVLKIDKKIQRAIR
jgi:uncharacterized membrane protein YuzA (DUF378 family)